MSSDAGGIVHKPARGGKGARVLALTGASTFLGRGLLQVLEESPAIARIVVIDQESAQQASDRVRSYVIDRTQPLAAARITEILTSEGVDTVVHLGSLQSPTRNVAQGHELESVGTLNLLNACREHAIEKLVVGSSTLIYGAHHDNPNFLSETHPLRGLRGVPFLSDKIDVERQVEAFARDSRDTVVTVLRFAPVLGPTIESYITRWLERNMPLTLLGFDPLVQFVHEVDALLALKQAIEQRAPGAFNIVGEGVLPISTVLKLLGRRGLPAPYFVARRACELLYLAGLSDVPAPMLRFLKHLCVADGERAQRPPLSLNPAYTTREAVLEFGAALRLREARLLSEAYA